jgi:Zn-dependent protease with chaperone function
MSGRLLAAALGRPQEDRWTGAVARGLWGLHGLAILALPAVSVGRLLFQHRRNDREIATAAADDTTGRQAEIQALLEELQPPGAGRLAVRVVIREAPSFLPAGLLQDGLASAQRFGLWRTGRLIALSPRALDRLERDELRALLAHELAHHLLGHCTIADVARWLGRLTFVGDGFARAVLDSFGFEIEADRLAVKVLGGQAGGLVRCLEKLAADRAPNAKRRPAEQTAIGYSQIKAKAGRRLAWWLFWKQYTSGALHGWHPSHATRLEALRGEGTKR